MKPGNWIFASALAVLGIGLVLPTAAQTDTAIVRAAKQKASEKKSGHVYTNDDFPQSEASSNNNAASQGNDTSSMVDQGDGAKSDGSGGKADAKTSDKKADAKAADSAKAVDDQKIKDLEAKLADAKKSEQDLQKKLDALQQKADGTQDQFRKNMYLDMISNQQITLSEFRREQESLSAQIEQERNKAKDKTADQEDKTADQN